MRTRIAVVCLAVMFFGVSAPRADVLKLDRWKGFAPDAALTRDGRPALAWPGIEANPTVRAEGVPTDLSSYKTLNFWVHVAEKRDSLLTLVMASENPASEGMDYYSVSVTTDFTGWRQFQIPLDSIRPSRTPVGWNKIDAVYWSSNWARKLDPATKVAFQDIVFDTEPIPGFDSPPGELLKNRSFENGPPGGAPAGWGVNVFNSTSTVGIDDTVAHSGKQSVRIVGAPGKSRAGVTTGFGKEQTDPARLYRFSAWVKVDGTTDDPSRTSLRITSVKGKSDVLKSDYRVCDKGPFDWKRYEWDIRLPAETESFNIVLFHHGEGTAWWDDVSLLSIRTVEAKSPASGALVEDGKPVFEWAAPLKGATLEIAPGDDFSASDVRRIPVEGTRFALTEPLPAGVSYGWRVVGQTPEGPVMTAPPASKSGEGAVSRFYVGSAQQMKEDLMKKFADARNMYERLRAFAERNKMWDHFSLLGNALKDAEALTEGKASDFAEIKRRNDDAWSELGYTMPWWNAIFLDDKALYSGLNLDYPGLEKVRAAVEKEDYAAARVELHAYYTARRKPNYYNKYLVPPRRSPLVTTEPKADALLTHQMPIHSYKTPTFDLGPAFDWHVFPIIDVEWPTKIHRHFHWSTLAGAYTKTGNERYSGELVQQMLDWCMDNPMERWDSKRFRWAWSTLNATVRIYSSWFNTWLQVRDSKSWTPDAQFVFLTAMREHGRFLMTHAARTGNWVIAEAQGLVELGIMLPEFKEAESWRNEGYNRLLKEIKIQVFDDGVQQERTPGYHGMTINCFMAPVQLGILNGIDFEGRDIFIAKLEKMHEYYLYMAGPDHRTAQIGDAHHSNVDSWLRKAYNMFRREDMLYVATDGKEGQPPVYRSYAFHNAGQYITRSAWADRQALWGFIDWGGDGGFHCHDDMGQISIQAYGQFLFIDAGIFAYANPPRLYFSQVTGHNTVMVDKTTQKRRDPIEVKWTSTDGFDVLRGLTDNSEPLQHERVFAFRQPDDMGPGYWLVVDRLSGGDGKSHRLDQRWHPTERMKGEVRGSRIIYTPRDAATAKEQPAVVLAGLAQPGLSVAIPPDEFVSYAWYKKIAVDLAQFTIESAAPQAFVTAIYPTPPGTPPADIAVEALDATLDGAAPKDKSVTAVRLRIQDRGRTFDDVWIVNHTGRGTAAAGGIATDGRVAMVRREGGKTVWCLSEGSQLTADGVRLFASAGSVDGASAPVRGGKSALATTGGKGIRYAGADGSAVEAGDVPAPVVAAPPRGAGEIRVELEPEADPMEPSSRAEMKDKAFALPAGAIKTGAAKYSNQGEGAVQPTSAKVGSEGMAFLHWDAAGHWLEWTFDVPADGDYRLYLRACTADPSVIRKVSVNGQTAKDTAGVEFTGTGGFSGTQDDWRTFLVCGADGKPFGFGLKAGKNVVRLENVDGVSLNMDWLALAPAK